MPDSSVRSSERRQRQIIGEGHRARWNRYQSGGCRTGQEDLVEQLSSDFVEDKDKERKRRRFRKQRKAEGVGDEVEEGVRESGKVEEEGIQERLVSLQVTRVTVDPQARRCEQRRMRWRRSWHLSERRRADPGACHPK